MIDHKNFKCPFCNSKLRYCAPTRGIYCGKCHIQGTAVLFETIIELKQKTDKAIYWLHEIVESHRYTPISTAEMALKEITALEQKDK